MPTYAQPAAAETEPVVAQTWSASAQAVALDPANRVPSESKTRRHRQHVTILIAGALMVSLAINIAGGLFAHSVIDGRDAALAVAQAQLDQISKANIAFQSQVTGMASERDRLAAELEKRTTERDSSAQQADALRHRTSDLETSLSSAQMQARQASQDSADQQQRTENANARGAAISAVLQLDDQIYREYNSFTAEVSAMDQAIRRNDNFTAYAAYARSQVVRDRLSGLFTQRAAALAKV